MDVPSFLVTQGGVRTPAEHTLLFVISFLVATFFGILITRGLRAVAPRLGLAEPPRHLPEGAEPVGKVGGLAIVAAMVLAGPATWWVFGEWSRHAAEASAAATVLLGALAMCALGMWDDLRELRPRTKLLLEVLIAAVVWWSGVRFAGFAMPGGQVELYPVVSLVVTVIWFLALANAFNLIDGADGVAGGAALAAIVAMFAVSFLLGQSLAAHMLAVTAGAVVGFLFYNFPPASVYLGDSGSLFLGFLLAGLGLVTSAKSTTVLAVAIPVVSLGLPVLNTGLAVVRRVLKGESIAARDLGHIHDRLRKLGHSPRRVALLMFAGSGVLALASLLLLSTDLQLVGIVYAILGVATFLALQRLRVPEFLELRRTLVRGLRQPRVIGRSVALREAIEALGDSGSLEEMLEEVGRAFEKTDFLEAEIRFAREPGERETDEVVWRWERPDTLPAGELELPPTRGPLRMERRTEPTKKPVHWEARVPFVSPETGRVAGWITVRRPWGGYAPADFEVLANALMPAVHGKVVAGRGEGPHGLREETAQAESRSDVA
jgi:UDP-GlcNAc:undecaprenyl-phosphate/decaprenyl-phosphate GlcNAc-1-phosphate transferase